MTNATLNKNTQDNKDRFKRGRGRGRERDQRTAPEFDHQVVNIRRVTRVVAGGRRFSFSATVVIGDRKGRVGVGLGKSRDTAGAIDKAIKDAQKNLLTLNLGQAPQSIPHEVEAKFDASRVLIKPASGRGLVAGSSVRLVLEYAGITDVNAKLLSRTKNKLNNAKATVSALSQIKF